MFSLNVCWIVFAVIFLAKDLFAFYIDICGIPYLVGQSEVKDKKEAYRNLTVGVNIHNLVKILLNQASIFAIYKTVECILYFVK